MYMYKCPFCNSIFSLLEDLRSHFFKQHKNENMKCPFCNFESKTYDEFAIHLLMTKEKSHDDLLKLLFNQIKELIENGNIFEIIQEIENKENVENINQIQIEDNQVQEIDNQKMKIKKRKPKRKLKCPYCGYEVVWYRNLKHHISLFHKMNIIEKNKNEENEVNQNSEEKNNQQLQSQNENENIKDNNSETENFDFNKCPYCGQEFIRINELRYHIKNIHLLNNYNCPFCKIEFEVPLLLLIHLWNFNDKKHRYLHGLITKG